MKNEREVREEMCHIGRQMYDRGYIVGDDGNMSVRFPGNVVLVTPSMRCKGTLAPDDLIKTDLLGNVISGKGRPSSEIAVHLAVYQERPDVRAVVHAHPPTAVAFTLANISLEDMFIPEVAIYLGSIATVPYATPGSKELAEKLKPYTKNSEALLLERHGSVTYGKCLKDAYSKLEYLEYTAKVVLMARQLAPIEPMPQKEVAILSQIKQKRDAQ